MDGTYAYAGAQRVETTEEQRQATRLYAASVATDADDLRFLLTALGLLP